MTVTFNGIAAPIPLHFRHSDQSTGAVRDRRFDGGHDAGVEPGSNASALGIVYSRGARSASRASSLSRTASLCSMWRRATARIFPDCSRLALNADGTQNSCANPAACSESSVVTIFLNGIGVSSPVTQATGNDQPLGGRD